MEGRTIEETDLELLVLGSGVAGLSAAVRASERHGLRVGVLTKAALEEATTRWAQGGVAAAMSETPKDIGSHLEDTLNAGAGLCDIDAVRVLVDEGPVRLKELISLGAQFDRDPDGSLQLAREGGHSVARVVHAGGVATGAEIERALVAAVRSSSCRVFEHTFALDLVISDNRCVGVVVLAPDGSTSFIRASHVLLATGGAGQLFSVTTNPSVATGDGVAMALRAGVATADLEFFQFHPTALHHPVMPRPLLSEALRGHGAKLRDHQGDRFIDELLPRDVVSRAIHSKLVADGVDHVWLDATSLDDFAGRFPTVAQELENVGLDPARDWLPVAPAAHHQCGGVVTDLSGATTLRGLWAAGETSCSGVHGANRLASNSLLEGLVFGPRAVDAIAAGVEGPAPSGVMAALMSPDGSSNSAEAIWNKVPPLFSRTGTTRPGSRLPDPESLKRELQRIMFLYAGVERDRASLDQAAGAIASIASQLELLSAGSGKAGSGKAGSAQISEVVNLTEVGWVLVNSALERTESRGTHSRSDYPDPDPALAHRIFV